MEFEDEMGYCRYVLFFFFLVDFGQVSEGGDEIADYFCDRQGKVYEFVKGLKR